MATSWWLNQPLSRNISQIGNLSPIFGVKIKHIWNHHPGHNLQKRTETTRLQLKLPSFNWNYQASTETTKLQLKLPSFNWNYQASTETTKLQLTLPSFTLLTSSTKMLIKSFCWSKSHLFYLVFCVRLTDKDWLGLLLDCRMFTPKSLQNRWSRKFLLPKKNPQGPSNGRVWTCIAGVFLGPQNCHFSRVRILRVPRKKWVVFVVELQGFV